MWLLNDPSLLCANTAFSFTPSPPFLCSFFFFHFDCNSLSSSAAEIQRLKRWFEVVVQEEEEEVRGVNCTRQFRFTVRQTLVGWGSKRRRRRRWWW